MAHEHAEVRVSPVRDLAAAPAHHAGLGSTVERYDDGYGFAAWRGAELHLVVTDGLVPDADTTAVFLHVGDPDAVAAAWSGVPGTTVPEDRPWGIREGAHVDPDGTPCVSGAR